MSILILGDGMNESVTKVDTSVRFMESAGHWIDDGAKDKEFLESNAPTGTSLSPRKSVKRTFHGSFLRDSIAPHEVLKDLLPPLLQDTIIFRYQKRVVHMNNHGTYDCPRVWYFGTISTNGLD